MISTNLTDGLLLSSALRDLVIRFPFSAPNNELAFADVSVVSDHGPEIFKSRLFFSGNTVTVHNFRSLVEQNLSSLGESYDHLEISVRAYGSGEPDIIFANVIFCRNAIAIADLDDFLAKSFLCYGLSRRIPLINENLQFFFFANKGESVSKKIRAVVCADDAVESVEIQWSPEGDVACADSINEFAINPLSLLDILKNIYFQRSRSVELLAFSISVADRSMAFYIDKDLKMDYAFRCRNMFNCPEILFVPAATTVNPQVDKSTAYVAGALMTYDLKPSKSFKVESAGLDIDEAANLQALFFSPEQQKAIVFNDGSCIWIDIAIDDVKADFGLSPDAPPSVSFSWTPLDQRPLDVFSYSANFNIFASQFNHSFL